MALTDRSLRRNLLLGTALVSSLGSTYVRRAYAAGGCVGSGGVYSCSGTINTPPGYTITLPSISVTTSGPFNVTASGGNAFTLTTQTGQSFIDTHAATLTTSGTGFFGYNSTSGSITVSTNGTINAPSGYGLHGTGAGSTSISITANNIYAGSGGVFVQNLGTGTHP